MQTKDQSFLGTEPVGKLLVRLAVPTVIAQLVNMLYNIVDRIYIGHIAEIGSLALTGVGVCMPIIMIVTAFAALVASGGAPRASIALGRGDHDTGRETAGRQFFAADRHLAAADGGAAAVWSQLRCWHSAQAKTRSNTRIAT